MQFKSLRLALLALLEKADLNCLLDLRLGKCSICRHHNSIILHIADRSFNLGWLFRIQTQLLVLVRSFASLSLVVVVGCLLGAASTLERIFR